MAARTPEIAILGAGMAGVATAYQLAVREKLDHIVLIDALDPLSLTSAVGTQAYRNWWPGPDDTMLRFVTRSIDLLEELAEESGNAFAMNRRGYLFASARPDRAEFLEKTARSVCGFGAGPFREHPGTDPYPPYQAEGISRELDGIDFFRDPTALRKVFPDLTEQVIAAAHVRRCGWLDAKRLGAWLLKRAIASGVELRHGRVSKIDTEGGRFRRLHFEGGGSLEAGRLIVAAGPYLGELGRKLGLELPVFTELHAKMVLPDPENILPPDAPMMIWADPVRLPTEPPLQVASSDGGSQHELLDEYPPGAHFRPRGSGRDAEAMLIWTYHAEPCELEWPPPYDPLAAEVMLRGVSAMLPRARQLFARVSEGVVDGGFYCKTRENRPLIGRLPVEDTFVIGALSGFGIMASQAAAELLSAHVHDKPLPGYASALAPERFEDPQFLAKLEEMDPRVGQL